MARSASVVSIPKTHIFLVINFFHMHPAHDDVSPLIQEVPEGLLNSEKPLLCKHLKSIPLGPGMVYKDSVKNTEMLNCYLRNSNPYQVLNFLSTTLLRRL